MPDVPSKPGLEKVNPFTGNSLANNNITGLIQLQD
jgi:hypothetical protein